ncbi:MAG: ferric reductase-like transmembrane domain-containing protein [Chloroflexota bacterium]
MTTRTTMLGMSEDHPSRSILILLALLLLLGFFAFAIVGFAGLLLINGVSVSALISGLLAMTDKTAWHLSRSAGTVAYLLLSGSTVWGLLQSSKLAKEVIPAGLSYAMHNILSWLALIFTGLHALVLLFDNYYTYTLSDLTIPFIGPYRPIWVGLGIIGFYLMLMVIISFQVRTRIGQQRWRALHYFSFVVYALATVHGLAAGTDSSKLSMRLMYLGSGLLVFFLTNYRLLMRDMSASRSVRNRH